MRKLLIRFDEETLYALAHDAEKEGIEPRIHAAHILKKHYEGLPVPKPANSVDALLTEQRRTNALLELQAEALLTIVGQHPSADMQDEWVKLDKVRGLLK